MSGDSRISMLSLEEAKQAAAEAELAAEREKRDRAQAKLAAERKARLAARVKCPECGHVFTPEKKETHASAN